MLRTIADVYDVLIKDPEMVATWLARIGRFGGQHPTSNVLIHSLEVVHRCPEKLKLWGLLHDVHEVLTGDVTKGYKSQSLILQQETFDGYLCSRLGVSSETRQLVSQIDISTSELELKRWESMEWAYEGTSKEFSELFDTLWMGR